MDTLTSLLRTKVTAIWGLLIAATLLSFWLGFDHEPSSDRPRSIPILVLAFVKVRFVGLYFMELRAAPTMLRALFEGYCFVLCATLLGLYLLA